MRDARRFSVAEYLLDTSFLIDLLNGEKSVEEPHEGTKGEQATSTVCVYELSKFDGFDVSSVKDKRVLRFSPSDAHHAGNVYRELEKEGEPVGETDSMIAGVALNRDLILVTRDEDFRKVKGLETLFY
jgi:tRNA(fMet)-specific endonuclease VapC